MKKFSGVNWPLRLLQLTIILIPFSYQPRIYLSKLQGLNLELSLIQVAATLFIASMLPAIIRHYKDLINLRPLQLLGAFVAFNWFSMLWSADVTRTLVLVAFWTFLLALVVAVVALFKDQKIKQKDISNPLLIGAAIGAFLGCVQFIGVSAGLDQGVTLIKQAYNAELFGFPRIQAMALEPQFYANALIAPMLYLCWRLLFTKYQTYHLLLLGWLFATFLLTVSRGGTLGMVAALTLLTIGLFQAHSRDAWSKLGRLVAVLFSGLLVAIVAVYISGSFQANHSGAKSVEMFIDQMSHGVIDIKLANGGRGVDGLVEASTTGRFFMVEKALEISAQSGTNYIIGIGAGSFGPVFQQSYEGTKINNHVINNQYVEFFTELGIIGLGLFMAFIVLFAQSIWRHTKRYKYLLAGILAAYLVQYFFFSLQTNVVHIWIFVGISLGLAHGRQKLGAKK